MRLPKRGFNRYRIPMQIVNVEKLDRFRAGSKITVETLADAGLVRRKDRPVKLLGRGELKKRFTVHVDAASASAIRAVIDAGGSVVGFEVDEAPEGTPADEATTAPEAAETPSSDDATTPDDQTSDAEGDEGTEEND
jgi:large subunit ribosomal protein L15